ncbi:MAG: UDP-3-O-(3-hydroxymyristoyl)glucosamine N-acyltransferase [Gammaproteobacteria bacterium]
MRSVTLAALAEQIEAELCGEGSCRVHAINTLDRAGAGDVSYLYDRRYRKFLKVTAASAVILGHRDLRDCPVATLLVGDPFVGYARAAQVFEDPLPVEGGIHPTAWVSPRASIDAHAFIAARAVVEEDALLGYRTWVGPGAVIGRSARIGDYTRVLANVTICHHAVVGRRCIIQPGAVIGAEGFTYAREGGRWLRIPHFGGVYLGDDVDIGAASTVDRGSFKDTVIEEGVKLDNLIQIGHNVRIGAHTAIAGCVGIAGGANIGKRCMIGGGAGIAGHLVIGDDITITAMSMVTKSIRAAGTYSSGWPATENRQWKKRVARLNRMSAR